MKLFKSLLVAPASLGLLAPMAATANEVTINDFNAAEEIAVTNSRVDGLEARLNNFEAGSFSETTSASFSADFAIGWEDGKGISTGTTDGDEDLQAVYSFQIDLNTSFTGDDNLYVGIETGNYTTSVDFTLDSSGGGGNTLSVTSMKGLILSQAWLLLHS